MAFNKEIGTGKKKRNREITCLCVISFLKRNCTCTLLLAVKIFFLEKGPGFEFQLLHLNLVVPVDKNSYRLSIKRKHNTAKWALNMKTVMHHLIK